MSSVIRFESPGRCSGQKAVTAELITSITAHASSVAVEISHPQNHVQNHVQLLVSRSVRTVRTNLCGRVTYRSHNSEQS